MVSPDPEIKAWQLAFDNAAQMNKKKMKELQNIFTKKIEEFRLVTQNQETSPTDRFVHRLFVDILEDLYKELWPPKKDVKHEEKQA